ncbi:MAG: hypothetical protein KDD76_07045, partial [Rickettsiales bacterium]|nr:hypothetical protein [Rickettsiales bacterium]
LKEADIIPYGTPLNYTPGNTSKEEGLLSGDICMSENQKPGAAPTTPSSKKVISDTPSPVVLG